MIYGSDVRDDSTDQLIGGGLPLADAKPLTIARHLDGEVSYEGPLALDYRTWPDQAKAAQMATPQDVTYTMVKKEQSYDGRVYRWTVEEVDDK